MDDVIRIKKKLEKITSKKETKLAMDLLKSLDEVPMSLEVLQKTHIGMTVNKIRKSIEDSEVNSLSKSMIKKWKKLLSSNAPTAATNTNNTNNNGTSMDSDTTANQGDDSSSSFTSAGQKYQNPIESHSSSNDNTSNQQSSAQPFKAAPQPQSCPSTTSEVRLKCRELLADALKKPFNNSRDDEALLEPDELADRIEEAIFQEFKRTDMKYKNRVRSRVANLGDTKNPDFKYRVRLGDVRPERIAKMTADEMASKELKQLRDQFTKEAIDDHQMAMTTGTQTSEIKCSACKKSNVTYNQVSINVVNNYFFLLFSPPFLPSSLFTISPYTSFILGPNEKCRRTHDNILLLQRMW